MRSAAPPAVYPSTAAPVIGLFCVYVVAWFLQVGERKAVFAAVRFEFVLGALLLGAAVIRRMAGSGRREKTSGLHYYVVAFFLAMLIQIPASQAPAASMFIFWERVVKFSCMAVFIATFVKSPRDLRAFLAAFLLACFYIVQESFRGALTGSMMWMNQGVMRLHGDTSMFFHPNSLAGVSLGVVPFVYFLYPVVRRKALKLALLGLAVAALGCVLYSGSRAAYLAVFVFLAYVFASSRRKGRLAAAGIVAIGLSLPFVPAQYKMRFQTLLTGQDIEGRSMERRKEILFDGLHVLKEHPLGVGIAAFPTVRMRLFGRKQDTHNLYLEVATNLGVQGLVIFLLLIRKMLKTFSAARLSFDAQIRRLQDSLKIRAPARENLGVFRDHLEDLRLLRAASLAGTGYIVIRLALGMFGMDTYEIYWWIGSGLAIALFNMNIRSVRLTERLLEAPPPVALAQGKP